MSSNNSQSSEPKSYSRQPWGLNLCAFPQPEGFEVVEEKPRIRGLFHEMLQDKAEQLLSYTEGRKGMQEAQELLRMLVTGTRSINSLHPEERQQLDEATAFMLTEPEKKRKVDKPMAYARKREAELVQEPDAPPPVTGAFWWL
jgi:hypothetical protein